jgi:parvulin-like peptidyl-prolyl isomerase
MVELLQDSELAIAPDQIIPLLQRYGLLPQLVREFLIDRAIAPITLTEEESLKGYEQFYQRQQLKTEEDLQNWMAAQGLTRDQLEYLITRDFKLEQLKHQTWEKQLESYFLQRKTLLDRVIYSLIRVKSFDLAQELYFRIQEGEQAFSDLAREYSQGAEAQTGGLIGPVELSVPHPALAKLLANSQPGQLLPPTRLMDWVVLARLESFLPATLDDAMRQRLLNELFETWLQQQMQQEGGRLMQQVVMGTL